jgi:hypothetical protein
MIGFCRRAGWSIVLGAALAVAMTGRATADSASAQAFVEAIYAPYLNKNYKGTPYGKPANLRRYFEPRLANAIVKDMTAAKKRGEVPTLDGDPFIDAQDWEIADLAIAVKIAGTAKALATVKFTNMREPKTVTLDLMKTSAGWRIAEIDASSGSLRKLFKLK